MSKDGAAFNRLKAARQQEQCLMSKLNRIALDYRRAADAYQQHERTYALRW